MSEAAATVEKIEREEALRIICEGLSEGETLREMCRRPGMPAFRTVYYWIEDDPELSARFARARQAGFDAIAEETFEIADNTGFEDEDTITTERGSFPNKEWVMRSKLRVETRLKLLAKWDPKRYGETKKLEHSGPDGKPLNLAVLEPDAVVDQLVSIATEYPQAAPRLRKLLQSALDRMPA